MIWCIVLLLVSVCAVAAGWRGALLDVGVREHALRVGSYISAMPPVRIQLVVDRDLVTNFELTILPLGVGIPIERRGSGDFWLWRFGGLATW